MTSYDDCEVEDFLNDIFFIQSVLQPTTESDAFWANWIQEYPHKKNVVEKARSILLSISIQPLQDTLSDTEVNSIISNVLARQLEQPLTTTGHRSKIIQMKWLRIAAAILIFFTAGFFAYRQFSNDISIHNIFSAGNTVKITNHTSEAKLIIMDDGSLAVLKPNSSLSYPRKFSGNKREVQLQGEAFFEVHKNPKSPFLVHSQNMVTRVLGTSFTVKAFDKDEEFKVIVNTGKVLVYKKTTLPDIKEKATSVSLTPNQQVIFSRKKEQFTKDILSTPLLLSKEMAKEEFTFINTPLSAVIYKLDKAYGINIDYNAETLGKLTLTASLSDRPLNEKIKLICQAVNAKYRFSDGRIFIEEETK